MRLCFFGCCLFCFVVFVLFVCCGVCLFVCLFVFLGGAQTRALQQSLEASLLEQGSIHGAEPDVSSFVSIFPTIYAVIYIQEEGISILTHRGKKKKATPYNLCRKCPNPLSGTVVRQWDKTYSCHGRKTHLDFTITVGQCRVSDEHQRMLDYRQNPVRCHHRKPVCRATVTRTTVPDNGSGHLVPTTFLHRRHV